MFCVCCLTLCRDRLLKSRQTPREARSDSPAKSATKPTNGRTSTRSDNVTSTGSTPQSLASATPPRCTSAAQVSSALTAVCLALVNVMFYLADGVLGTLYYVQSQLLHLHPVYETLLGGLPAGALVRKRLKPLRPGHLLVCGAYQNFAKSSALAFVGWKRCEFARTTRSMLEDKEYRQKVRQRVRQRVLLNGCTEVIIVPASNDHCHMIEWSSGYSIRAVERIIQIA